THSSSSTATCAAGPPNAVLPSRSSTPATSPSRRTARLVAHPRPARPPRRTRCMVRARKEVSSMGEMLAGRVAVVTGAGRGIGRGVALELAAAGAKVVVNDFGVAVDGSTPTSGPAFEVVEEIKRAGSDAVASTDSVAEWDGAKRIVDMAIERFGKLDVL